MLCYEKLINYMTRPRQSDQVYFCERREKPVTYKPGTGDYDSGVTWLYLKLNKQKRKKKMADTQCAVCCSGHFFRTVFPLRPDTDTDFPIKHPLAVPTYSLLRGSDTWAS